MNKSWLVVCVALLFLIAPACGGGGSDGFNFNGEWILTETVDADPSGLGASLGFPTGHTGTSRIRISESGGMIILDFVAGPTLSGTANRGSGTFTADGSFRFSGTSKTLDLTYEGGQAGSNSMVGTSTFRSGSSSFRAAWTAERI